MKYIFLILSLFLSFSIVASIESSPVEKTHQVKKKKHRKYKKRKRNKHTNQKNSKAWLYTGLAFLVIGSLLLLFTILLSWNIFAYIAIILILALSIVFLLLSLLKPSKNK